MQRLTHPFRVLILVVGLSLTIVFASAAPVAAEPTVTVSDTGLLRDGGQTAIVEVTVACDYYGPVNAGVTIQQPSGRSYASGSGYATEQCAPGATVRLFVEVPSAYAPFKSGPATFAGYASGYSPSTGDYWQENLSGSVRLQK